MAKFLTLDIVDTRMGTLDMLPWSAALAFECHGTRVGIRFNRPQLLDTVRDLLPCGAVVRQSGNVQRLYSLLVGEPGYPDSPPVHELYEDSVRIARDIHLEAILHTLESKMRLHVAEMAPQHVFVHAGVVGWEGRAIVIAGRSQTGKTTLVAELLRAGAMYYSDEYAVLDRFGDVHPFSQLLGIREDGVKMQTPYHWKSFGARAGRRALPVGLVLLTRFCDGALWRPRQVTPGRAVLGLLRQSVAARRRPAECMAALQTALVNARIFRGIRGEAKDVVPWVERTMHRLRCGQSRN